uniref:Tyrosine-protein kinase n=1 Tax=Caenorhabditis japonica TaxID=281687 RepID=A0A8R1HRG1_CAEJA
MFEPRSSAESDATQTHIARRIRSFNPDSNNNSTYSSSIDNEQYYHGLLPREDVSLLLKENGDFVVRSSEAKPGEARSYILSVLTDKTSLDHPIKHLIIYTDSQNRKYWIDKKTFETIRSLLDFYQTETGKPVVHLIRAIPRQSWELEHESITIQKKLGEGAFGEVSMGVFKTKKMTKGIQVALKQAKLDKLNKEQIKEFMSEARHLRTFQHPNIVKLYGVAVLQEPLYMVMELASHGALDSYLQKNPTLPLETRNEMILQAAWGIEYLHSKQVIHRDIAARNCLYGDQKVKISDFGLSRTGLVYQMEQARKIPIRWCSVETLVTGCYTSKTDVWSYGILCWEIYNNVSIEPYTGVSTEELNQKLRHGLRMDVPTHIHADIQKMIQNCWLENPSERPSMTEITGILQKITGLKRPPEKEKQERSKSKSKELTTKESSNTVEGLCKVEPNRKTRKKKPSN